MRKSRKLAWISWSLGSMAVIGLSLLASYNVLRRRSSPPVYALESARKARDEARRAGAFRWAGAAMQEAEAAWNAALLEQRIEETRFVLLRNFTESREALTTAEEKFRRATSEANHRKTDVKTEAEAALAEASDTTGRAEAFADAMHLGLVDRTTLGRSKVALTEGRILYRDGSYADARDRARLATTQA